MQDREMRAIKEEKLFDILVVKKLLEGGKTKDADRFIDSIEERTLSGMTAEEIDAVKERANRAVSKYE